MARVTQTPREIVEVELQLIAVTFNTKKELHPMFILIKDDKRFVCPVSFSNDTQKDIVNLGMRDLVKNTLPDIVVYAAEAWMIVFKKMPKELPRPSTHPDKVEVVIVQIEFKTGEKFSCMADILRNGDDVKLDKFDITSDGTDIGRFVDFFPVTRTN